MNTLTGVIRYNPTSPDHVHADADDENTTNINSCSDLGPTSPGDEAEEDSDDFTAADVVD